MSPWFARLGRPVTEDERLLVRTYLRGLGIFDVLNVDSVETWSDARVLVTHPDWDRRWWDAEQLERQRLYARAVAERGQTELLQLLASTLERSEEVQGAAARVAEQAGSIDRGLAGAAAGAASEALHLAELARITGESDQHPFPVKESLFARGRWPLGIVSGRYSMF